MFLLSPPRDGGAIATRAFIPHRVHTSIGVLMAATVAAGVCIPGTVGADLADPPDDGRGRGRTPGGAFPSLVRRRRSDADRHLARRPRPSVAHRPQALRRHGLPAAAPAEHPPVERTRHDRAHCVRRRPLGNVELLTPTFDEEPVVLPRPAGDAGRRRGEGDSVYLRTWDDYQRYTIKLTASDAAGVGRTGFAHRRARRRWNAAWPRIEATGLGEGWVDGEVGTGPTYLFRDPDGHAIGIYYETERYVATDDKPALKNQASAFPGRGVNVRRLDHINFLAKDVDANGEFIATALGGRESEQIQLDAGRLRGLVVPLHQQVVRRRLHRGLDQHGNRLHHIAFAPDTREDILRAADIFLENGIHIETGPHKHAIQQTFFLYVWEPGGNRIELCNAGARLLLDPDSPGRGVDRRRSARRARRGA